MAVTTEATITGQGNFQGAKSNLTGFNISTDVVGVSLLDSSGGVGSFSFSAVDATERFGSALLSGAPVTLYDSTFGSVSGVIASLNSNGGVIDISCETNIAKLVRTIDAGSVNGTFQTAMIYYFGLVGITLTAANFTTTKASTAVVAAGWKQADLWTKIKELCVLYGVDLNLTATSVVFGDRRTITALPTTASSMSWGSNRATETQYIEVMYYGNTYATNWRAYPEDGYDEELNVLSVDPKETITQNFPVNMFITSVEQPVAMDKVPKNYTAGSAYSAAGSDGLNMKAADWTGAGGKITVAIGEDGTSIDVKVQAPSRATAAPAPYRIGETSGTGNFYSSLYLRATGVRFEQKSVKVPTGSPLIDGSVTTVDSMFVSSRAQAFDVAQKSAGMIVGSNYTLSMTTPNPQFTTNVTNIATAVPGARVPHRYAVYRIKSVNTKDDGVDYTAEADTTCADFNTAAAGMTCAQFNASFAGLTVGEFNAAPLAKTLGSIDGY